ncbi:MAG: hypothetical protein M1818_008046 [Claussenomyces sp. TS43310]|nr:MAG: hypothetical protein M1818_008046 [Claussenomyces sp. TS43310]
MPLLMRSLRSTLRPKAPSPSSNILLPAPLFLQLPSTVRNLHASRPAQFLSPLLDSTHTLFTTLHGSSALPWAAILPLTALSIRLLFTLPMTIYTRRSTQRQLDLQPLLLAWRHQVRRDIKRRLGHLGPEYAQREEEKALRRKRRELYGRWRCGYWKTWLPAVQLPVWLLVMETIRGMCGASKGILGLIWGSGEVAGKAAMQSVAPPEDAPSGQLEDVDDAVNSVTDSAPALPSVLQDDAISASLRESSFSTEGALWFTNLSAPDPHLLLPFMLSGAMLLNLMPARRKTVPGTTQSAMARRLTNGLRVVALFAGPMTLQMPSAMLLYWISSSLLACLQGLVLDRLMPLRPPVPPCKPRAALSGEEARKV